MFTWRYIRVIVWFYFKDTLVQINFHVSPLEIGFFKNVNLLVYKKKVKIKTKIFFLSLQTYIFESIGGSTHLWH